MESTTQSSLTKHQAGHDRPYLSLTLDQVDEISLRLAHVKSLASMMVKVHEANGGELLDDMLTCSQVIDDLVERTRAFLNSGGEHHG